MDINSYMDIIDSRDIVERIEELESEIEDTEDELSESDEPETETVDYLIKLKEELTVLQNTVDQADDMGSFNDGEALIRDSYFVEYAQELAEDIGAMPNDSQWPAYCIDWEYAARELQYDYTDIYFDDVLYWIRA